MHPKMNLKLHQHQHSLFHPGGRIQMNILPLFVNLLLPWAVFTFISGVIASYTMYKYPGFIFGVVLVVFAMWGLLVSKAAEARRNNPDPTWFSYVALAVGIATFTGLAVGLANYSQYTRPYFTILDLKRIRNLDPGAERGRNMMDAGMVTFSPGTMLDERRSWHFIHKSTYCVAPIISNNSAPWSGSYDFWAVGQDCCSQADSDFRCGAWGTKGKHGAVRSLDDESAIFYRLAVKQAESLYGLRAAHPVFFEWTTDPRAVVNSWKQFAWHNIIFYSVVSFVVSLFGMVLAMIGFSLIGRRRSMHILGDAEWEAAGRATPLSSKRRGSGAACYNGTGPCPTGP